MPTARAHAGTVFATVVTYQPGVDLARNLEALRQQVDQLVVIDNGSSNLADVRQVAQAVGCELVANKENVGVAAALNQAAALACERDCEWLATFDQDSLVERGSIKKLLAVARSHPGRDRIAIVAMEHRDRATNRGYQLAGDVLQESAEWRVLRTTITSGCLVKTSVLAGVGLFDEGLFIDGVDHDFCLRCRRQGLLVVQSRTAFLSHAIGNSVERRLFGRRVVSFNHAPVRRYYITRNGLEIARRYVSFDWFWAMRTIFYVVAGNLLVLALEKHRLSNLFEMLTGARDFAARRFGPRDRAPQPS